MRHTVRAVFQTIAVAWVMLILAGCAARLLPAYDQATYEDLTDLNAKALALFSALSAGGTPSDYPKYEDQYNELVGGFGAARMTLANRPPPPIGRKLFGTRLLAKACHGRSAEECLNETPHTLDQIVALFTKMRDVHRQRGLPAEAVSGLNGRGGFKGQYQIEIAQALTIEAALQR
jgi:hypothetical protein